MRDDETEVGTEVEETVVVTGMAVKDHTAVVATPPVEEQTVVVANPIVERAERAETQDATVAMLNRQHGSVAMPVDEPEVEIPADLAQLMFKQPLDPHRRVKESPFPQTEDALPRVGVRQGMPVVYGTRAELDEQYSDETAALDAKIGPPPPNGYVFVAQRDGLPSTERQNRKYSLLALGGGTAVLLVAVFGLWGVALLAFG
ncbi:hypothetical protein G7066_13635 [Leucobacter coleopterorum]|uniref:Serine/threonine protein kinase n=1 Tax=Leucobacter coleopterorum TaxID=2714933 RepID=A0ABX6K2T8_9MICO|nr:hypothetical protein [Leucobacter coleopterorum]QIM19355.1 hypothetical protein G7066_13635 [Leucobacter coleopterorum]